MSVVEISYIRAVNEALAWALARYPESIIFGEDVALPNGPFGATKGLRARFDERVFDTPISESAMVGTALGAAVSGLRPVVEIMYGDFLLVAMDQIVNQVANARYVSNGALVPRLTIRTQQGATPGSCAQHSQSLEALFAHIPGLRVGLASNAVDAYEMLRAAIASDDPVLIFESRRLYAQKAAVALDGPLEAVSGSRVVAEGGDVTVVSWGAAVSDVLTARTALDERGVHATVVDLRWLSPLDLNPVFDSVARTGRLAVVHEANTTGGFGGEIVARVVEEMGSQLTAAPVRIGARDCRMPAAPSLSAALLPTPDRIAAELMTLVAPTGAPAS
ncbi:MAG: acetoin dehydrogenase [Acidimicrobiaceae bacterium]|nr:acetoin dehydrogenase [Acidimicrobiaceae bacterium]